MITVLIRTKETDGSRTVHGVVHLSYDPARMDVIASYPEPGRPSRLTEERIPRMACVRNLSRIHSLPAEEVLKALKSPDGRVLETGRLRKNRGPQALPLAPSQASPLASPEKPAVPS